MRPRDTARRAQTPERRQRGFTLIEIMAVVLIIGLLTTIVGAVVFSQVDSARGSLCHSLPPRRNPMGIAPVLVFTVVFSSASWLPREGWEGPCWGPTCLRFRPAL